MNQSKYNKIIRARLYTGHAVYATVRGTSMESILHDGDSVKITRKENYSVGDILMYDYKEEGILLHRLLVIQNSRYYCKGDNSYRLEEVGDNDIYGVAVAKVQRGEEKLLVCPKGLPEMSLAVHDYLEELGVNLEILHKSELYKKYKHRYLRGREVINKDY